MSKVQTINLAQEVVDRSKLSNIMFRLMEATCGGGAKMLEHFGLQQQMPPPGTAGDINCDVVFTINGIDIDLAKFADELYAYYDQDVKKAAYGLVKEKCGHLDDVLYKLTESVKRAAIDAFPEGGEDW